MTDLEILQDQIDVFNSQIDLINKQAKLQVARISKQIDATKAQLVILNTPPTPQV